MGLHDFTFYVLRFTPYAAGDPGYASLPFLWRAARRRRYLHRVRSIGTWLLPRARPGRAAAGSGGRARARLLPAARRRPGCRHTHDRAALPPAARVLPRRSLGPGARPRAPAGAA